MKVENVVVRFLDGRLLKGTAVDFNPPATQFHLVPAQAGEKDPPVTVRISDLKAVFFVRSLPGDPRHSYRNKFEKGQPFLGRKVRVTFADGEVIVGWTMGYGEAQGFYLFPADNKGNTARAYVVRSNAKEIELQGS